MKTRHRIFDRICAVARSMCAQTTGATGATGGRDGGRVRASLIAVGVAVFAALSVALPQAAQAQVTIDFQVQCVGQTYRTTIGGGTCDRNGTQLGLALREGDQFEVEVRVTSGVGNIPTTPANANRAISAIVAAPAGITTTGGTSGTINSRTGIRFTLNLANSWSHKMTWTVTDDATAESQANVNFRLYNDAFSSVALGSQGTMITVGGGSSGRTRTVTIQESDQHVLMPQLRTGNNAPAEGPSFVTFDIVLASGSTDPGGLQNVYWYVTFDATDTNPASEADFTVGNGAGQIRDISGLTRNSCNGRRGSPVGGNGNAQVQNGVATTPTTSNIARLSIRDDSVIEESETFTLHLCGPTTDAGITYGSAAATITDNDGYTLTPLAPTAAVNEGDTPRPRIRYNADRGSGTIGAAVTVAVNIRNSVPSGHSNFGGLDGTGRACDSDWVGGDDDDSMCGNTDQTIATVMCTIPATTAHNVVVTCPALPMVANDTENERAEHFGITLSGLPTGVTAGAAAQDVIEASDPIGLTLGDAPAAGTEGGSVDLRINFAVPDGVTAGASSGTSFLITFEYPSGTFVDTDAIPVAALATGYYDWSIDSTQDTDPEAHDVREYLLRGNRTFNLYTTLPADAADRTRTITFNDDDAAEFTIRACGGGNNISSADVNENAGVLSSATDTQADCAGAGAAASAVDHMYFRIDNYSAAAGLRGAGVSTTLTYCLGGTATGGTAAQVTANPAQYDYTWPTGYDPDSTSAADAGYPGSCNMGRGTVTIPAAHTARSYRFSIQLNNDDLNEGDETITAELVAASQGAGYTVIVDNNMDDPNYGDGTSGEYIATRTIKDDDDISVSIANAGTDADGDTDGHQVQEGGDATFTVTLDHASAGPITVAYTIGGDVEAADYTDTTGGSVTIAASSTSGTITIALAQGDGDSTDEDLTVTLGTITAGNGAGTAAAASSPGNAATQIVTNRAFEHNLTLLRYNADYSEQVTTPPTSYAEDAGAIYFLVAQAGVNPTAFAAAQPVTWTVTHAGTNGTSAADFTGALTGTVTMPTTGCAPSGESPVDACRFTVTINNDTLDEFGTEGFSVVLSVADDSVDGGIDVGSGTGALTIADNDNFTIDIQTAATSVSEGGFAVVTLTPTVPAAREVTMDFDHLSSTAESGLTLTTATDDVDATLPTTGGMAGGDFGALRTGSAGTEEGTSAGHTVTFPADSTAPQYLLIPITADNLNEAAETFQLTTFTVGFSGHYSGGYVLPIGSGMDDRGTSLTFTIAASDAMTASVARAAATYNEGQTARFTVTLAGATAGSAAAITVPYAVTVTGAGYTLAELATANSGLTAGTSSATGSLTISAGDITGNIDLVLPVDGGLGASSTDQMLTVTIPEDDATTAETDEGITVAAGGGSVTRSATNNAATVTVNFVDAARTFTITAGPTSIAETDSNLQSMNFTVTLNGAAFPGDSGHTAVNWRIRYPTLDAANGVYPASDADFHQLAGRAGSVSFANGSDGNGSTQTFDVDIAGDQLNEPTETFMLYLVATTTPADGIGFGADYTVTITDDDPVQVAINRKSGSGAVAEGSGALVFEVALTGGTRATGVSTVVPFTVSGLDAGEFDITMPTPAPAASATSHSITIAQGTSGGDITVTLIGDDLNEAQEMVTVTGAAVGGSGLRLTGTAGTFGAVAYLGASGNAASVAVTDDDAISVSVANHGTDADDAATDFQVEEGGSAVFRISIDHASAADVTVPFTVSGLEAADVTGGMSAIPTSPVTITAGQTHADITIPLATDEDTPAGDETSEAVTVTLGATGYTAAGAIARSATASQRTATQNIIPRGAVRTLTVTAAAGPHPEGPDTAHTFTVTLTGDPFTLNTTVGWSITHGSPATSDADFTATSGSVTFGTSDGDGATKNFTVNIVDDNINEASEIFTVQASVADPMAHGGTAFGIPASLTITDDDDIELSFRAAAATVSEAETAADTPRTVVLTVNLGAVASRDVDVSYIGRQTQAVAATSSTDDVAATPGAAPTIGDSPAAGVDVYISNIQHPTPGRTGRITIPGGSQMSTITVTVVDDDLNEAPEVYALSVTVASGAHRAATIAAGAPTVDLGGGTVEAAAIFTITDDDPITYSIARRMGDSGNARELGQAHFTITFAGATDGSAAAVTIPYTVSSGSYDIPAGTVTVPAGMTEHTFALDLPADARSTGNQAVTVTLGTAPTIASGGGSVTRVTPNNAQVTVDFVSSARTLSVTLASNTINENDAGGGQASAAITIALGGSDTLFTAATTTVNWAVVHGTTTDADFVNSGDLSGTVSFDSTDRSTDTFTIDIAGDNLNEGNETFTIRASVADPSADGGTASGTSAAVTIMDDDPIALGITTSTGPSEGANFNLTFNFGALASRAITLDYTLSNTRATGDVDADLRSGAGQDVADADNGSVTLATTATQVTIDPGITITDDTLNEAAETFVLTITLADDLTGHYGTAAFTAATAGRSDCTAAACAITYTIEASDPITLSIADAAAAVSEGATAEFTITLAGAASGSAAAITVPYTVASSGGTYDVSSITPDSVIIPAEMTSHTLRLRMPTDTDADSGMRTVTVTLGASPTVAAGGGAVTVSGTSGANTGEVEVTLVEAAHTFALTSPAASIDEGESATYTVTRTGDAIGAGDSITITWSYAAGTPAPVAADFTGGAPAGGTLVFTGSRATRTFTITTAEDNLNEPGEQFTLSFSIAAAHEAAADAAGGAAEPDEHTVTITDDDPIAVTVTAANGGRVSEGGTARLNVNLGAIPTQAIRIIYGSNALSTAATDDVDATHTGGAGDDLGAFPSPSEINIAANANPPTGSLSVSVTADNLNEAAETFVLRTSASSINGAHGTATVVGATDLGGGITGVDTIFTIAASDPITYTIARHSGDAADPTDEGQQARFTVSISGASAGSAAQIQIPYTVTNSGSYNVAMAARSGMVTFAANSAAAQTITLTLPTDGDLGSTDPDQTLTVQLGDMPTIGTGGGAVTLSGNGRGQVRVNFIDSARTLTVTGPDRVVENNMVTGVETGNYTITLRGMAFSTDTTVTWQVTAPGGTGRAANGDFRATADLSGTVTFATTEGNGTTKTFSITVAGDLLNEADETFTVQISVADQMTDGGTAYGSPVTTTIEDNDDLSVGVAFATTVAEDAASGVSFTITLTGTRSGDVTVPFTLSGLDGGEYDIDAQAASPPANTAALTIDSGGASGTVVFESADSNTFTVNISLTDDNLNEATETLTVTGGTLTAAGGIAYTSNNGVHSVMVTDTDAITVSIAAPTPTTQDEGSTIEFPVSFAGATSGSAAAIDVAYTVAWTATSTGVFDDLTEGTLTIAAGQTTGNIRVRIQHSIPLDSMSADETLRVTLGTITVGSGGGSATGSGMADVTVNWIDAAHTIEVADATVDEGAATITVTRSASMDLVQPVDIMWEVTLADMPTATDATAADFSGAPGSLRGSVRFAGSQTEASIRLAIIDDNLAEMAETFTVTLSENLDMASQTANSVVAAADSATVTITDNDNIAIRIGGQRRVSEERTITFPVTLTATPTAELTVMWAVAAATGGMLAPDCSAPSNIVGAVAGDFADTAGGAASMTFAGDTLTFAVGATSQTITLHTSAGAQANSATGATASATGNGYDQTCDRQFTITLTATGNGGGTSPAMAPMAVTITISEDNPEAIATLNEAVLPEVARAVATNQVAAIAERVGAAAGIGASAPSFNLNGQSTMAGSTAANLRDWAKGDGLDTKELLRDMDFVMPLGVSGAAGGLLGENRMALWGGSDYRDFSGEGDDNDTEWDGEMFSLHVGADARVREDLLVGVMVSHSDAESDYSYNDNGRIERGDYDLELTGFSPYLSWDLPGASAWLSLGYGQGDLTIDPDQEGRDTMQSDVDMTSFGAGGARLLRASDAHELRLKGDAFTATVDVDGDADNENLGAIEVNANRLRVLVESRHNFTLASGATIAPLADLGARYDGGDGSTGTGIEVGGGVHYTAPNLGLTVETRARVLLGHTGDQDEWGIGGVVRLDPGADGQGLSLSLTPSYGDSEADAQAMWDHGVAGVGSTAKSADPEATLAAEIAYGMPMSDLSALGWRAFGLGDSARGTTGAGGGVFSGGLLTPYSAMHIGDKNDYRLGLRWKATHIGLDLSARRLDADNRLTLEGKVRF